MTGNAVVTVNALPDQIKVQSRPDQNAIVMTVDNRDAMTAALLADRISAAFVERQTAENQETTPGGNRIVWVIAQPAELPTHRSR